MRFAKLLAVLLVLPLLAGCFVPGGLVGSARLTTKTYEISNFSRIDAGSAFVVDVRQGDTFEVEVTANDNIIDRLDVAKSGDTLRLHLRPGSFVNTTLRARVTMPKVTGISLSGASRGTFDGFSKNGGDDLNVDLSGASTLKGDIVAGRARMTLSGASNATLDGSARTLTLNNSGASRANLADWPMDEANVNLSGASSASIDVSGKLDCDVSGASTLEYAGNPTLGRVNTSGASTLRHK